MTIWERASLWSIAWLIAMPFIAWLPSVCLGEPMRIEEESLGLRGMGHKPNLPLTPSEAELYRRLSAFGGSVRVMDFRYWEDVKRAAWEAKGMTIFVIDGPYEVWLYFRDHGWELIPMRLDGKWIVRKRIGASA